MERLRQLFRNVRDVWALCSAIGDGDSMSDEAIALTGETALGRQSLVVSVGVEATAEEEDEAVAVVLADETLMFVAAGALEGVEVLVTISGVSGVGVSSKTEGELCAMERKRKGERILESLREGEGGEGQRC